MLSFIRSSCVLCHASVKREISLCHACEADLPTITHACKICGIPLSENQSVCGQCLKSPPAVDYTVSLFHYESPINYLITELKFANKLSHAAILGFLLKQKILSSHNSGTKNNYPDALIPVPLHQKRLIKRGFNQSLEITKELNKGLQLPIHTDFIQRHRATHAQSELDVKQRKKNIKGCFNLTNKVIPVYNHIVIIDDVVTTGATINEVAKTLKKAGFKKVGVWSIARAVLGIS